MDRASTAVDSASVRRSQRHRNNFLRLGVFLLLAVLLVACNGKPAATNGSLTIEVDRSAVPAAAAVSVTVTGPDSFSKTLAVTEELKDLKAGTYTVSAGDVTEAGVTYEGMVTDSPVTVQVGKSHKVTVTYSAQGAPPPPTTGALNVVITGLPSGLNASVDVSGPGIAATTLEASQEFPDLEPGPYLIEASKVISSLEEYTPTGLLNRTVTVTAGDTVTETVDYVRTGVIETVINVSDDVATAGSLRNLIAESALPGSDIIAIHFDPDVFAVPTSIQLTSELLLDHEVRIVGPLDPADMPLVTIIAAPGDRVLKVDSQGDAVVQNLRFTAGTGTVGGGGGAVFNNGKLSLINVEISDSDSSHGGGIFNNIDAELHLNHSLVTNNSADFDGGGIHNASGQVVISDSTISDNQAHNGGGISNEGELVVEGGSQVAGNIADQRGGGIYNAAGADVEALISATVIDGNEASLLGGGIWNGSKLNLGSSSSVENNIALESGGGIYNSATGKVDIVESRISSNKATTVGGGIRNLNELNLTHSTVNGNRTETQGGGGLAITGGSGYSRIINTTFADNVAKRAGGGILVDGNSRVWLSESTIRDNHAEQLGGGGIAFNQSTQMSRITDSTLTGNKGAGNGGAIFTNSRVEATNLTIVGNEARRGGGAFVSSGTEATLVLFFSTVSENEAVEGSGGGSRNGSGLYASGPLTLRGTIVAGNLANDPLITGPDIFRAGSGIITSHGFNVIGNDAASGVPVADDLLNVDPLLGPLQANGGRTHTMQLLTGSPAIGLAPAAECQYPSGIVLTRDQRDEPRPGGTGLCDAGAFQTP